MLEQGKEKRFDKWIFGILILGSILTNVKNIFTSFNLDVEYALAMSYRMVQGDKMFLQMWEPHQTSAFLATAFMQLYLMLFHTTTGIAVYMNLVGVLLKGATTAVVYRTLRKYTDRRVLLCMCIFFFTVNPKDILMPEFSNMQLWFSVLLFCSLFQYIRNQEKKRWLFLSGLFLCLEVLAYPSCVIVYFGVLACLILYAGNKRTDILLLTGECVAGGGLYALFFAFRIGVGELWRNISNIVLGDESHTGGTLAKWVGYGRDAAEILAVVALYAVLSYIVVKAYTFCKSRRTGEKRISPKREWYIVTFLLCFCIQDFISIITIAEETRHLVVYLPICILGWTFCKYCNAEENQACRMGIIISACGVVATLLLTNLTVLSSLAYGVLGVCVSMLSCEGKGRRFGLLILFCGLTVFRSGFMVTSMTDNRAENRACIFDIRGIVRSGPAMGIMSTYMGPYIINATIEEWKLYVEQGDRVLLVGGGGKVDTLGYLYENTEVCIDSTICTPTYNEKLERYWEENPQKYPNVVAVDCWYGDLRVDKDSWIMQWLENEFRADRVVDGKYWRYYMKEH